MAHSDTHERQYQKKNTSDAILSNKTSLLEAARRSSPSITPSMEASQDPSPGRKTPFSARELDNPTQPPSASHTLLRDTEITSDVDPNKSANTTATGPTSESGQVRSPFDSRPIHSAVEGNTGPAPAELSSKPSQFLEAVGSTDTTEDQTPTAVGNLVDHASQSNSGKRITATSNTASDPAQEQPSSSSSPEFPQPEHPARVRTVGGVNKILGIMKSANEARHGQK